MLLPGSRHNVLLIDTEAQACVLQTAIGLIEPGFILILVADGISSRQRSDHDAVLQSAVCYGIEIATAEMAIFEWLDAATHSRFKDVLVLLKSINN